MLIKVLHWTLVVPYIQGYTFTSLIASNSAEDPKGALSNESFGPFTRLAWKSVGLNLQRSFDSFC